MTLTIEPVPRPAHHYRTPTLLQDIRLLDLLELSGTTIEASRLVELSQPTVSRRYRALARDFALVANRRRPVGCRFGSSGVMQLLRHGCRAHRFGAGVARIGTDLILQPLLEGCNWLLPVPPRFRALRSWLELVSQGVLDGALISGLELQGEHHQANAELEFHPVGQLPLALAISPAVPLPPGGQLPAVLVPNRGVAGGLQRALQNQGLTLRSGNPDGRGAAEWRRRLEQGSLAMPIAGLDHAHLEPAGREPIDNEPRWRQLPLPRPLSVPLWLLLPAGWRQQPVLSHTLEQLRSHPGLQASNNQAPGEP
ncbi:MAG: hypothetical protein R6U00_10690 [Prochlorococcaceae cyanobacterium]